MWHRLVIAFLPRSKNLLISWLQSPSVVILEPKKIKSLTVSILSPFICHDVMGPDAMIFVFWMLSFKPAFSLSSFTFIKRLFSSSSLLHWLLASLTTPKPLTMGITTNWKILKEMGILDHLTCLLRNLYAGQEATVRTGHGTTDWFPNRERSKEQLIGAKYVFKPLEKWFIGWMPQGVKCAFLTLQGWSLAASFISWASVLSQHQSSLILSDEF